jgi:hypothetical protein
LDGAQSGRREISGRLSPPSRIDPRPFQVCLWFAPVTSILDNLLISHSLLTKMRTPLHDGSGPLGRTRTCSLGGRRTSKRRRPSQLSHNPMVGNQPGRCRAARVAILAPGFADIDPTAGRPCGRLASALRSSARGGPQPLDWKPAKYGGAFQGCQFDGRELRNISAPPPASPGLAAIVISSRRWPLGSPGNDTASVQRLGKAERVLGADVGLIWRLGRPG